jgi:hypothetical protein
MEKLTPQHAVTSSFRWNAPVSRWSAWEADETDASPKMPDVSFVEASLRRRLSLFARMALKVAHDCAGDLQGVRMVFASRHGDLERTTSMLLDLTNKEILSPTTFSMSVLNACTGIYSIAQKEQTPSTAISSAESSFGYGLLEASLQLASNPDSPVLFVYADEPAPSIYGIENNDISKPLAIGILLKSDATAGITCETEYAEDIGSPISQSQAFLECLNHKGTASTWRGENKTWKWSWHEQTN